MNGCLNETRLVCYRSFFIDYFMRAPYRIFSTCYGDDSVNDFIKPFMNNDLTCVGQGFSPFLDMAFLVYIN